MANLEKYKRNLVSDWLEGEERAVPPPARSAPKVKAVPRKFRTPPANGQTAKPDPALMREPAPPSRLDEKHSQASSPEHLRKLQRLSKLRAPYQPKGARPRPGTR
ncbi:MAG: hypothetical protein ABSD27_10775 [Bryobacteraceae bacterium]|jgi:hypothetical protein